MFTFVASPSSRGNETERHTCTHCRKPMYVKPGAQSYRCPHCDWAQ